MVVANISQQSGVTLTEVVITIVIVGILAAFALPSFEAIVMENQLTTQTNAMVGGLYLARSEAIKRRTRVVLCRSNKEGSDCNTADSERGYGEGWIVFVDRTDNGVHDAGEEILRVFAESPLGMKISSKNGIMKNYVSFGGDGINKQAGGQAFLAGTLTFEIKRDDTSRTRCIVLASGGRVKVDDCSK